MKNVPKTLKSNPGIIITKADKGGQFAIVNETNHVQIVVKLIIEGFFINI